MEPASTPTRRITSLDGLRGIAAVVVLVYHALLVVPALAAAYFDEPVPQGVRWFVFTPAHIVWAGTEAVTVFFVLSGIAITLPVLKAASFNWLAYYPSRLIRLYVPVAASVFLAIAFALAVPRVVTAGQSAWMDYHVYGITPRTVLQDLILVFGTTPMNSPLWSLQWEVIFSLLLPLYVWVAIKLRRHGLLLVAISVVVVAIASYIRPGSSGVMAQVTTASTYLPVFMVGCAIAVRLSNGEMRSRDELAFHSRRWIGIVLLFVAVMSVTSHWWFAPFAGDPWTGLSSIMLLLGAIILVMLAVFWPPMVRFLNFAAVLWLGRVSFSLYLTHEPIVVSVGSLLPLELRWLTAVISIPISFVVAWLFYRFVESPSHRLSQTIKQRISSRSSHTAQALSS
ncbi:acyltransferase [Agreia sp. COWG]|uniref:acyltransferase family protein n=1 Tax=Agreia sp. COWG TaxID=2773266 RepID=UPI001928C3EF|nr:Peptidoglycan/LPS O-acetylase OafA/YrhL, contains acyltransferase and SGNH-hydrolase domains [Agreia sp. COWG]